jgi:HEPN domain-containing protein
LKAILVFLQVDFPHVHNLETISNLIPDGWSTRIEHPDLGKLTAWAVESRYPGEGIEPTEADAKAAVRMARAVLDSVERDLTQHGFDTTR